VFGRQPRPPPRPFFPFTGMASLLRVLYHSLFFLSFFLVSASYFSNDTGIHDTLQYNPQLFPRKVSRRSCRPSPPPLPTNCFPAVGFNTPSEVPASLDGWWCDPADEFGFLGFSYEITLCEHPHVSSHPLGFMNCLFDTIRSEFGPAADRFREHPKYLQRSLRSPLWGLRQ
jgi:hypothetical protein